MSTDKLSPQAPQALPPKKVPEKKVSEHSTRKFSVPMSDKGRGQLPWKTLYIGSSFLFKMELQNLPWNPPSLPIGFHFCSAAVCVSYCRPAPYFGLSEKWEETTQDSISYQRVKTHSNYTTEIQIQILLWGSNVLPIFIISWKWAELRKFNWIFCLCLGVSFEASSWK